MTKVGNTRHFIARTRKRCQVEAVSDECFALITIGPEMLELVRRARRCCEAMSSGTTDVEVAIQCHAVWIQGLPDGPRWEALHSLLTDEDEDNVEAISKDEIEQLAARAHPGGFVDSQLRVSRSIWWLEAAHEPSGCPVWTPFCGFRTLMAGTATVGKAGERL